MPQLAKELEHCLGSADFYLVIKNETKIGICPHCKLKRTLYADEKYEKRVISKPVEICRFAINHY